MSKTAKPKTTKDTASDSLEIVRKYYPNALTMEDTIDRAYKILKKECDLKPEQILRADCTCADDVNAIQEPENFKKMLGPFKMGGLNGFPFTGAVGMGAYSHHVPDDGALFIHYAPHIGIGKDEKIGEIKRIGRCGLSGSCGAAIGALKNLQADAIEPGNFTDLNFQFNTIEQIFLAARTSILKDENGNSTKYPLIEATAVMYQAIEERINLHFDRTDFVGAHCKYVIMFGGILINGDERESFSDCYRFDVYNVTEKTWQKFSPDFRP